MTAKAELSVPERLDLGARACAAMGSPLYGSILARAAEDYRAGGPLHAFFDADPLLEREPLTGIRLMGSLHYRALDGSAPELAAHFPSCGGDGEPVAAWSACRALVAADAEGIAQGFRLTPQTNEVARAMPLLAGLLAITATTAQPVRLLDIGASAGLNTRLDRYRYEGAGWAWGNPDSPCLLRNATLNGSPAHATASLRIAERAACDLQPLDVGNERDRLRLKSYVWADQIERFERLAQAIEAARAISLRVDRADMVEWIRERALPRNGTTTVIMHSVVTEHMPRDARAALVAAIDAAAAAATSDARLAWLRLEPGSGDLYETRVKLWPSGEDRLIAESDGHAQQLRWASSQAQPVSVP
jgi:hypothetical protein